MSEKDKQFYRGIAIILGSLARDHGMPSVAVDIMHANGVTYENLKEAGAIAFDLVPLHKEWMASQ